MLLVFVLFSPEQSLKCLSTAFLWWTCSYRLRVSGSPQHWPPPLMTVNSSEHSQKMISTGELTSTSFLFNTAVCSLLLASFCRECAHIFSKFSSLWPTSFSVFFNLSLMMSSVTLHLLWYSRIRLVLFIRDTLSI